MLSQESSIDLNFLMNHQSQLALEYKQLYWSFKKKRDYGISAFLFAEQEEREKLSCKIAEFLCNEGSNVEFTSKAKPSFIATKMPSLQGLINIESNSITAIETLIENAVERKQECVKIFLVKTRGKMFKEYQEIKGVVNSIDRLLNDAAGLNAYQWYLLEEYGKA